ncbi:hypothetical protein X732_30465 [Mesorhizobium sp. L2C066B000]|nr:hypothetical protein X732_30465 [Mesorhizobium sp. L2C066B000]
MSEPQSDGGAIDARLQEVHGRRVPQSMNSDTLSIQRRANGRSGLAVFAQHILNAMNAQPLTSGAGKQDILFSALRLFSQLLQTAVVDLANGVQRSLRPLQMTRMWVPVPKNRSSRLRPVISDSRNLACRRAAGTRDRVARICEGESRMAELLDHDPWRRRLRSDFNVEQTFEFVTGGDHRHSTFQILASGRVQLKTSMFET